MLIGRQKPPSRARTGNFGLLDQSYIWVLYASMGHIWVYVSYMSLWVLYGAMGPKVQSMVISVKICLTYFKSANVPLQGLWLIVPLISVLLVQGTVLVDFSHLKWVRLIDFGNFYQIFTLMTILWTFGPVKFLLFYLSRNKIQLFK